MHCLIGGVHCVQNVILKDASHTLIHQRCDMCSIHSLLFPSVYCSMAQRSFRSDAQYYKCRAEDVPQGSVENGFHFPAPAQPGGRSICAE